MLITADMCIRIEGLRLCDRDIIAHLNTVLSVDANVSCNKSPKEKRIEKLLYILALVKIKKFLVRLLRVSVSVFTLPEILVCEPTRSARITPFIYFP
ncbi:hypothetical protein HNR75_001157 [Tolumonas osonensis]|uniref:Uncharacterized protein n=1 Tax=Tolumonas osonensis TaxID=675874 RepID=A0A841GIX6_9GAMM|nr:hypothetical protein [Tolumonas osonensis]